MASLLPFKHCRNVDWIPLLSIIKTIANRYCFNVCIRNKENGHKRSVWVGHVGLHSSGRALFLSVSSSLSELSMPCDQYELHLQNGVVAPNGNPDAPVANLDQSSSTVFALQQGHTNIVLDHKSILHTSDKHADMSQL